MYPKKYVFWSKLRVLYSVVELQKVFGIQTLNLNKTVVQTFSCYRYAFFWFLYNLLCRSIFLDVLGAVIVLFCYANEFK